MASSDDAWFVLRVPAKAPEFRFIRRVPEREVVYEPTKAVVFDLRLEGAMSFIKALQDVGWAVQSVCDGVTKVQRGTERPGIAVHDRRRNRG